jgi:hypothetical protein
MNQLEANGSSHRKDPDSNNQAELWTHKSAIHEEVESHRGLDNGGFNQTFEMFGFPWPWSRKAPLTYTDTQLYLLDPSKKRSPVRRRCDLTLTEDGVWPLPLKVQAVDSLKDEQNCTWQRHYVKDPTTNTVRIAMLGSHLQAWFQHKHRAKEWAIPVSWICYAGMWIVSLVALYIWFVSVTQKLTFCKRI